MKTQLREILKSAILPGALAGLVGGIVFGLALYKLGALSMIAQLVGGSTGKVGIVVHLIIAAIIGSGFGLLIWHQRAGIGETLFWGLTYGTLWWFLGPLTLMPLFLKGTLGWDLAFVQSAFPSLLGHLFYGVSTALAFVLIKRDRMAEEPSFGSVIRGLLAGVLSAWFLGSMLNAQGQLSAFAAMMNSESQLVAWITLFIIGALAGLGFVLLYPRSTDTSGAGLIRGTVYGFLWWAIGALTLLPLIGGTGLAWSLDEARHGFAFLPGFLLFGALLALLYQWLDVLVRLLLSDEIGEREDEGIGTLGLRALGRGALAGIVGGLIFTLVMIQVGFLPTVASLIGAQSAFTGFIVHLVISILIGASYGILFRKQSQDLGSALGWGVSYGFFWWILGPLTLLPILLGATPEWTVEIATKYLASLIGHLSYGAALGIIFYIMETRFSPWWVSQHHAQAARMERRNAQALTSAPALWAFVVVIALIVPIVLGK
ncbi:hypothetical protein HY230_03855 [Candidatus Acetothermia bacterium]|nr:hypothetical protein [Candidatus Acetothermia bacterium]